MRPSVYNTALEFFAAAEFFLLFSDDEEEAEGDEFKRRSRQYAPDESVKKCFGEKFQRVLLYIVC